MVISFYPRPTRGFFYAHDWLEYTKAYPENLSLSIHISIA